MKNLEALWITEAQQIVDSDSPIDELEMAKNFLVDNDDDYESLRYLLNDH